MSIFVHFKNRSCIMLSQLYEINDSYFLLIFKMTIYYDINYMLVPILYFIITYKFMALYRKARQASFVLFVLKTLAQICNILLPSWLIKTKQSSV